MPVTCSRARRGALATFARFATLMPFAALMAAVAILGGTLLTYLYDRHAILWWRLCTGVCLGLTALGLIGFFLALWLGMTAAGLAFATVISGSPALLLFSRDFRVRVFDDVRNSIEVIRGAFSTFDPHTWA